MTIIPMSSVKAFVKINLTLEVLERLPNGYHKIESVIQKISLYDIIKIESIKSGIKIVCNDKSVPLDERNTCWQIAEILQKRLCRSPRNRDCGGAMGSFGDVAEATHCGETAAEWETLPLFPPQEQSPLNPSAGGGIAKPSPYPLRGRGDAFSLSLSLQGRAGVGLRGCLKNAENFNGKTGVKITINKKIPIGGGLGGGSSDAATTLLELNRLWRLNLTNIQMINIASKVGKDIPFFLTPKSTSLVRGLGEKVMDISSFAVLYLVLVNPEIEVSTKWAYNNLTLEAKKYQKAAGKMIKAIKRNNFDQIVQNLYNDFEPSVISRFPKIGIIKKDLINNGAAASLMSGSGSSVYGVFRGRKEARKAFDVLKRKYRKIYLVKTV